MSAYCWLLSGLLVFGVVIAIVAVMKIGRFISAHAAEPETETAPKGHFAEIQDAIRRSQV